MKRRGIAIVVGLLAVAAVAAVAVIAVFATRPGTSAASPTPGASLSLGVSPSASTSPSTSASADASPPAEAAGPPDMAWQPIDGFPADAGVHGVAFVDGRWFALGAIGRDPAVWFSNDGGTWTQSEVESTLAASEGAIVTDVAPVDGALVAIGVWGVIPSDQAAWAMWRSTDGGATWSEERSREPFALGTITVGGPGLVGTGADYTATTPYDSWVSLSSDGTSWTRVDAESLAESGVLALVALGDRLIAGGGRFTEGDSVPAAWISDDAGATWVHVDPGAHENGRFGLITDLAVRGNEVVAVGRAADQPDAAMSGQPPTAWMSGDGESWEPVAMGEVGHPAAVTTIDAGLVAVGNVFNVDAGPPTGWTSADGIRWAEAAIGELGSLQMSAVAGDGAIVIASGFCRDEQCASPLWRGEITEGN